VETIWLYRRSVAGNPERERTVHFGFTTDVLLVSQKEEGKSEDSLAYRRNVAGNPEIERTEDRVAGKPERGGQK
jgi:hypothetical protein